MRSFLLKTFCALAVLILLLLPKSIFADTLFISPASGEYRVGQTFSVRIIVSSQAQAINAVSAVLLYPTDKLQVTSISKIGSILNLWVEEPSFSNTQGTVSLEGVVPNPGFTGSAGPVITINFRVLDIGTAPLRFFYASLLANDGYGTNILRTRGTASLTLLPASAAPAEEVPVAEPGFIDLNEYEVAPPKTAEPIEKTISFNIPSWESIFEFLLKFLSVVIPLTALIFFLIHITKKGVGNIQALRKSMRKDLHNIDRLVEKSFDLMKEDVTESIHILERARMKRRLTAEEDAIVHRLRQNLVDAERVIHQEVVHAEKGLGN